jgi:hypothetical protein
MPLDYISKYFSTVIFGGWREWWGWEHAITQSCLNPVTDYTLNDKLCFACSIYVKINKFGACSCHELIDTLELIS